VTDKSIGVRLEAWCYVWFNLLIYYVHWQQL